MIIVELHGGLGNQMFQYAMGKKLSKKYKTELKLDLVRFANKQYHINPSVSSEVSTATPSRTSLKDYLRPILKLGVKAKKKYTSLISTHHYHTDYKRIYELKNLNIEAKPLSLVDMLKFRFRKFKILTEKSTKFDPEALESGADAYLMGFWQSPKYFSDIKEDLEKEFQVTTPINKENEEMLSLIQNSNSVFVHVRRGDYVSEKIVTESFKVCDKDYFDQAIKTIKSKVKDPVFFLFSDDPDWAKENIDTGDSKKYSSYNPGERGYDDLRLMYNCKHAIISNSTFSFWGAWLIKNKDKNIIAPLHWYSDPKLDDKDIAPTEWIKI